MKKIFLVLLFFILISSQYANSMGVINKGAREAAQTGSEQIIKNLKKSDDSIFDIIGDFFRGFGFSGAHAIKNQAIKKIAREISERINETKENYPGESKEITSWEAPEGFDTDEEKIAYHLSCVVVIQTLDKSIGSGFYINENTIITNYHVIQESNHVKVAGYLNDNTIGAKVVARDKENDLAALETYEESHKHCTPEKSFNPPILSEVIAVGHPDGIQFRVTKGEISAYRNKDLKVVDPNNLSKIELIDMSADIYFGSSGGPLFYKGKVLGVNTSGTEESNINFAIHFRVLNDFISKNNL